MRRLSVLLFLALAGTVPAAAPAHADDLCYHADINSDYFREIETNLACVPYDYAAYCFHNHTWVEHGSVLDAYYDFCVPAG